MNKILQWIFVLMTPIYLGLIYYKIVSGSDTEGLINVAIIMLVFYVPLQIYVKEYNLDFNVKVISENKDIKSYYLFAFFLVAIFVFLTFISLFNFEKELRENILLVLAICAYGIWWYLSDRLIFIVKNSGPDSAVKIIFWVLFILSLLLIDNMPLIYSTGWMYFLELIMIGIGFLLIGLALVPRLGYYVLKVSTKKLVSNSSSSYKSQKDFGIEEFMKPFIAIFLFYGMVIVPLIDWFDFLVNGIDPFLGSIGITVIMVLISAIGVFFQLKLFFSYIWEDYEKVLSVSKKVLVTFYVIIFINMGFVNTLNKNENKIQSVQKSVEELNNKVKKSEEYFKSY